MKNLVDHHNYIDIWLVWFVHQVWCVCHTVLQFYFMCNLDLQLRLVKRHASHEQRPVVRWSRCGFLFFSYLLIALKMTGWSREPRVWAWFDNPFTNKMRHLDEIQIECVPHSFNMLVYCEITKAILFEGGRYHQRWRLLKQAGP